jgi:hypothetical protein
MNSAIDVIANVQAVVDPFRSCVISGSSIAPYLSVTNNGGQKRGAQSSQKAPRSNLASISGLSPPTAAETFINMPSANQ